MSAQDEAGPSAATASELGQPAELQTKTRAQMQHLRSEAMLSPTTSVKHLLADTNAAPPPEPPTRETAPPESQKADPAAAGGLRNRQHKTGIDKESLAESTAYDANAEKRDIRAHKDGKRKVLDGQEPAAHGHERPTFQQTLADLRQFLMHFLKVLPFKGLQHYIKLAIGPVVRFVVRILAKILHRGQFGLASNVAYDIHLLLWKVRTGLRY